MSRRSGFSTETRGKLGCMGVLALGLAGLTVAFTEVAELTNIVDFKTGRQACDIAEAEVALIKRYPEAAAKQGITMPDSKTMQNCRTFVP